MERISRTRFSTTQKNGICFDFFLKSNFLINKAEEQQIKILQIKEKWGYLNIYTNFGNDELYKLIDEAEDKSLTVCEDCGSEENVGLRLTGWYTTICLDCLKRDVKERGYLQRWRRNSDVKLFLVNTDGTLEEINENEQP